MLLTRVEITDFLSIKGKLPIDFDKKVSILLGANDHGKSNILAAIEHLNEGKPITQDEENWDAKGVPTISFQFSLDETEKKEWKTSQKSVVASLNIWLPGEDSNL
jgi:recombinational DNA repair ATPase RecF